MLLIYVSFIGVGIFSLRFYLIKESLSKFDYTASALILGMAIFSFLTFFESSIGLFSFDSLLILKCVGLLYFTAVVYKYKSIILSSLKDNAIVVIAMIVLFVFMSVTTYANINIHGDARQYNLAFPWLMSETKSLVRNDTFWHNGTYVAYDILFMSVDNLTRLMGNVYLYDKLKQFDSLSAFFLPLSMWSISRAVGCNRTLSFISALIPFTLGSASNWGELKNDVYSAGLGIFSLSILISSYKKKDLRILYLASILSGWAVSVKLTNAVVLVIPFIYVYLSKGFTITEKVRSVCIGLLVVSPWMVYSYSATGSPFSPIGVPLPEAIRQWWHARDANGLDHSTVTAVKYFIPIIFDNFKISGNESIGYVCFASLCFSIIGLCVRLIRGKFSIIDAVVLSAILWFIAFYLMRFDNRFLSRYIVVSLCVFAVYALYLIGNTSRPYVVQWLMLIIVGLSVVTNPFNIKRLNSLTLTGEGDLQVKKLAKIKNDEEPYKYLETKRRLGEAVAINDHVTLFVNEPVFNLNPLHAVHLNLYSKNFKQIHQYAESNNIKYFLYRKNNSWGFDSINEFIKRCGEVDREFPTQNVILYKIDSSCN